MSSEPPNSLKPSPDSSPNAVSPASSTTLPRGEYRYELRRDGQPVATEEQRLEGNHLSGVRRSSEGGDRYEVEAELDDAGLVKSVALRYSRGPFSRRASYLASDEFLRGSLNSLSGRSDLVVKLGRFREIDADLILFRALIIAHARARGQTRFTGRVASLNPSTLAAAVHKQTYRQIDARGLSWIHEPRMGDSETIEIDARGVILRRRDNQGLESVLLQAPGIEPLSGSR
jgi:hypothetical protein